MFTKSDIRRVNIVIPAKGYSGFIVRLGKSGLLHLDREHLPEASALESGIREGGVSACAEAAEKIVSAAESFFAERGSSQDDAYTDDSLLDDIPSIFLRNAACDLREALRISSGRDKYEKTRALIERQIAAVEKKLDDIRAARESGIDLRNIERLKYISYIHGTVRDGLRQDEMKAGWFYILDGERLLVMFPPYDREDVLKILKSHGFNESGDFTGSASGGDGTGIGAEARLDLLRKRLGQLESLYEKETSGWSERISYLAAVYSVVLKISGAESALRSSDELVVVSAWINIKDSGPLRDLLCETCGEDFYLWIATGKENRKFRGRIPVLLKNIPLFRPFELLVRMMGTPGNSEVDPTPVAALAYTVLFGVMFGDLGQGVTIAAAGLFLSRYGMKKHGERNSLSDFGGIMIWCGISAAVFGLLYGSVFSYEYLIPAILFHPMENTMKLFIMAITTGVVFISAGLLFNVANGIIAGNYGEALFGTRGAAGFAVYLSVIYFVMRYILAGVYPETADIAIVLLPPAILFVLRGPLGYILFNGESLFPHGIFEYSVESMVEIIEMFSGFLGNTISFIRAGAFALSHAGLSIAVFTLAGIIDPSIKSAGAIAAIITGNIFIILLEGLVCSIQSMRLEYYEFFGKFFNGDGVAFAPFSLKFR